MSDERTEPYYGVRAMVTRGLEPDSKKPGHYRLNKDYETSPNFDDYQGALDWVLDTVKETDRISASIVLYTPVRMSDELKRSVEQVKEFVERLELPWGSSYCTQENLDQVSDGLDLLYDHRDDVFWRAEVVEKIQRGEDPLHLCAICDKEHRSRPEECFDTAIRALVAEFRNARD